MSNSKGKFIVVDGIDGSGKATQAEILREKLTNLGMNVVVFDFPRYGEKSASLVEMYLNGEFGSAEEVGPYIGSIFYAVDRYAASKEITQALEDGKIVISNRYVSASKGHQTSKIKNKKDRAKFITWLNELEYDLFKIPVPDLTLFLHVPAEVGYSLVLNKKEREYIKGKKQDIHEADRDHLFKAENAYLELIYGGDSYENWVKVSCSKGNEILPIDVIGNKIFSTVEKELFQNFKMSTHSHHQNEANISDKVNYLHSLLTIAYDMYLNNDLELCKTFDSLESNLRSLAAYLGVEYVSSDCPTCSLSVDRTFARLHKLIAEIYINYKDENFDEINKNLSETSMLINQFTTGMNCDVLQKTK